jgi:hypothetical protein
MSSKKWYNLGQCNSINKGKKALPEFSKLRENKIQKIKKQQQQQEELVSIIKQDTYFKVVS